MSLPNYRPQSLPPPGTNSEIRATYGASFLGRGQSASVIRRAIDRRGLRHFLAATLSCVLLAGAALTHVWLRTRVTEKGYLLSKLSGEHQRLLRERERLTLQTGQLSSPARLEELATSRLSMGPPPAERTVVLVQTAPVAEKTKSALAFGDKKRRK